MKIASFHRWKGTKLVTPPPPAPQVPPGTVLPQGGQESWGQQSTGCQKTTSAGRQRISCQSILLSGHFSSWALCNSCKGPPARAVGDFSTWPLFPRGLAQALSSQIHRSEQIVKFSTEILSCSGASGKDLPLLTCFNESLQLQPPSPITASAAGSYSPSNFAKPSN